MKNKAVILQLVGHKSLFLRVDPNQWKKAYNAALRNKSFIEITNSNESITINPSSFIFWQTKDN